MIPCRPSLGVMLIFQLVLVTALGGDAQVDQTWHSDAGNASNSLLQEKHSASQRTQEDMLGYGDGDDDWQDETVRTANGAFARASNNMKQIAKKYGITYEGFKPNETNKNTIPLKMEGLSREMSKNMEKVRQLEAVTAEREKARDELSMNGEDPPSKWRKLFADYNADVSTQHEDDDASEDDIKNQIGFRGDHIAEQFSINVDAQEKYFRTKRILLQNYVDKLQERVYHEKDNLVAEDDTFKEMVNDFIDDVPEAAAGIFGDILDEAKSIATRTESDVETAKGQLEIGLEMLSGAEVANKKAEGRVKLVDSKKADAEKMITKGLEDTSINEVLKEFSATEAKSLANAFGGASETIGTIAGSEKTSAAKMVGEKASDLKNVKKGIEEQLTEFTGGVKLMVKELKKPFDKLYTSADNVEATEKEVPVAADEKLAKIKEKKTAFDEFSTGTHGKIDDLLAATMQKIKTTEAIERQKAHAHQEEGMEPIAVEYKDVKTAADEETELFKEEVVPETIAEIQEDVDAEGGELNILKEKRASKQTELYATADASEAELGQYMNTSVYQLGESEDKFSDATGKLYTFIGAGPDTEKIDGVAGVQGDVLHRALKSAASGIEQSEDEFKAAATEAAEKASETTSDQRALAEKLGISVSNNLAIMENAAKAQKKGINTLMIKAGDSGVAVERLDKDVEKGIGDIRGETTSAGKRLMGVVGKTMYGSMSALNKQFAVNAKELNSEEQRMKPTFDAELERQDEALTKALGEAAPALAAKRNEMGRMGFRVSKLKKALETSSPAVKQALKKSKTDIEIMHTKLEDGEDQAVALAKSAFRKLGDKIRTSIRSSARDTSESGTHILNKITALAEKLTRKGVLKSADMHLESAQEALDHAESARAKSMKARTQAEMLEDGAEAGGASAIDQVARLANAEGGLTADALANMGALLGQAHQSLHTQAMSADATANRLRGEIDAEAKATANSLSLDGTAADGAITEANSKLKGMLNGIPTLPEGMPTNGGDLDGLADELSGIIGIEPGIFKRLQANSHRMVSVESRELARIIGFVSELAKSFGVTIEGFEDPSKARNAALGFGDAAASADALTEAARLEAEKAANGDNVDDDATKAAADALAKKLGLDRTNVEGSLEELLNQGVKEAQESHAEEIANFGSVAERLHGLVDDVPNLRKVAMKMHDVSHDVKHHIDILYDQPGNTAHRLNGVIDSMSSAQDAMAGLHVSGGAHGSHLPQLKDPESAAAEAEALRVKIGSMINTEKSTAEDEIGVSMVGYKDETNKVSEIEDASRDEIVKDVSSEQTSDQARMEVMREETDNGISVAENSDVSAGEMMVQLEKGVQKLETKVERLKDSAMAFGQASPAQLVAEEKLIDSAQRIKSAKSSVTKGMSLGQLDDLSQHAAAVTGQLRSELSESDKIDAKNKEMDDMLAQLEKMSPNIM